MPFDFTKLREDGAKLLNREYSCPHCGAGGSKAKHIDRSEKGSLNECESCGNQSHFPRDWMSGKREDESEWNSKAASRLPLLHRAKAKSDERKYRDKSEIIRNLMTLHPDEWVIDQDDGEQHAIGITHKPTKYKFHLPREQVLPTIKAAAYYLQTRDPWAPFFTDFSAA